MKEKVFFDTNILIYLKLRDKRHEEKRAICSSLVREVKHNFIISTQVINEFYCVMLRNGVSDISIQDMIGEIIEISMISIITLNTIKDSWKIKEK